MPQIDHIRIPSNDEIDQLVSVLEFHREDRVRLAHIVRQLAEELELFATHGIHPQEARRRALAATRKIVQALEEAISGIGNEPIALLDSLIGPDISHALGDILSLDGIRRLISDEQFFSIDEREIDLARSRSRDGGAKIIASELQHLIRRVVDDHPTKALQNLLKHIKAMLDSHLAVESTYRGGRPSDPIRAHALERLRQFHEDVQGQKATTAPGGAYSQLCHHVFMSLGLSTDGLETAIKRKISPRRKQR